MKNTNFIDRTGEKHITNQGYEVEIIEYFDSHNCTIIIDNRTIVKNVIYRHIKEGYINNPFHPKTFDVGYFGVGEYVSAINGVKTKTYNSWRGILKRSYCKEYHKKYPSYIECTVDERWHNFQNFAKWYEENFKPYMQDWHLDKDLKLKGNKIYSPETCIFIPNELNCVFTNRVGNKNKIEMLNKFKSTIPLYIYESLILDLENPKIF